MPRGPTSAANLSSPYSAATFLAISASSVGDEEPREHFNRACALLDLIGSGDPDQPTEAQVDPREHRRALMEALDVVLLVGDAVEEADAVDAERAKRDEAPQRKATTGSVEHRNSGASVRTSLTARGPSASTSIISRVRPP